MTDRDHFAAAALTGLLASETNGSVTDTLRAEWAYRAADAMLRERDVTKPMPQTKRAEVSEQEPVAWRAFSADGSEAVYSLYEQARADADDMNWSVEPLYRSPQTCPYVVGKTTLHCSLTPLADNERAELQSEIDRLRLAIRRLADQDATLSACNGNVTVTMDGTLTDEEREALEWAEDASNTRRAAAIRGLLKRLV